MYTSDSFRARQNIQSLEERASGPGRVISPVRALSETNAVATILGLRESDDVETLVASPQDIDPLLSILDRHTMESTYIPHAKISNSGQAKLDAPAVHLESSLQNHRPSAQYHQSARITLLNTNFWFKSKPDPAIVEHLLDLYFTWIHPFHQMFSQDRFLVDFRNMKTSHCSALLVNAIAAFACHYADTPPESLHSYDYSAAGSHFFAEAEGLLAAVESPLLTTAQALAIMGLQETSHGRVSNGHHYISQSLRLALEMGLNLSTMNSTQSLAETEERTITFWGIFNIESYVISQPPVSP